MLKSYITVAFRNLRNKPGFSLINVVGLAIGMACAILIFAWVQNEYSYEDFQVNKNTIYKVWNRSMPPGKVEAWDVTSSPMGKTLKADYPEIKNAARVFWSINRLFNYGGASFKAKGLDVDEPFLSMFTFPLVKGDATHALSDVHSVVITQKLANKIFGDADPMNKLVKINNRDTYKVTGVLKDIPGNTQFDFEYLVSLAGSKYSDESWGNASFNTYVQLQPNAAVDKVNAKIKNIVMAHSPTNRQEVFLHPMSKWHLYARFENGKAVGGRIEVVHLLLTIAGIILLIACINFMNLSTAQSQKRAKEVGVRKAIGASRFGLINQFLSESILISCIAGVIALLLVAGSLSAFNQLTEKSLVIHYSDPVFELAFIGFILFTGLLAGSYPAFLLSGFRPVKVLKGGSLVTGKASLINPRKVLVVAQFSVAIVLIVSTIVIYRQVRFAQSRDTGYNVNNLLEIPVEGDIDKNYAVIKSELLSTGTATDLCRTNVDVTLDASSTGGLKWDGMTDEQKQMNFSAFGTSAGFVKTMGLKLIDGRDIDVIAHPADSTACMFNESAIKRMGLTNPVGKLVSSGNAKIKIVGVFKDFIIGSPYRNVNPMVVWVTKHTYNVVIRLNAKNDVAKNLAVTGTIFKKYNPAYPFTYQFADAEYEQKFNDQHQTGTLAFIFAGLTIFISCLGLFGLASYMAESRSKEIGIRKVLGASVAGIAQMLTREFVLLVIIAIVIAVPVAGWAMNKWLQDFTYRIEIGWLAYVIAGLTAIVIAILTVSLQTIKAGLLNPVNSIKSE